MFKQSPVWAAVTVVAAFVAGGLAGWGVGAHWRHHHWMAAVGPLGPGVGGPHAFLRRRLDLTPAQDDSIRAIFERHRPALAAIWKDVRPRFDSLRAALDSEIAAQLTPAQRKRFEEMQRRMTERRDRLGAPEAP